MEDELTPKDLRNSRYPTEKEEGESKPPIAKEELFPVDSQVQIYSSSSKVWCEGRVERVESKRGMQIVYKVVDKEGVQKTRNKWMATVPETVKLISLPPITGKIIKIDENGAILAAYGPSSEAIGKLMAESQAEEKKEESQPPSKPTDEGEAVDWEVRQKIELYSKGLKCTLGNRKKHQNIQKWSNTRLPQSTLRGEK